MIRKVVEAFLRDCRSRSLSRNTVMYYEGRIDQFETFCKHEGVNEMLDITPDLIRSYMITLEERHTPGGRDACYRAISVLMRWFEKEYEPENWKNPICKVQRPKVPNSEIRPVTIDEVHALLDTCRGDSFVGLRDRAYICFLLDTGVRVNESVSTLVTNCDLHSGEVYIANGKGGKSRTVWMGKTCLKYVRRYMKNRFDKNPSLWVTSTGESWQRRSAQGMLQRRSFEAEIEVITPHMFRKAFATIMSQTADIFSLSSLTGDSLEVLNKHYVKRQKTAAQAAHERGSPVDTQL